jgi:hypothetical protein
MSVSQARFEPTKARECGRVGPRLPNLHANVLVLACGLLSLSGCGLLEIGPSSRITEIEPVSFRVEVIELGPLNPGRVAFPSDMPVTEAMPGDRVRMEIEVVDTDGLALADDRLDSIWLLLAWNPVVSGTIPLDDPRLDLRCDELEEWTINMPCRLGEGRGSIEFEVPPLDPKLNMVLRPYAVIAWDGQSAEDCWTSRRLRGALPSNCGFVRPNVQVGPSWWLFAYAAAMGLETSRPVERIPAAVFLQQANRAPKVVSVSVDDVPLVPVDGVVGPIAVEPGDRLSLQVSVDQNLQFSQFVFYSPDGSGDYFTLFPERVATRVLTAGPISFPLDFLIFVENRLEIAVDDDASPGVARVLLAVTDLRGGESLVRVELEIQ